MAKKAFSTQAMEVKKLKTFSFVFLFTITTFEKYPYYVVQTLIVKVHITPLTKFVQRTLVESKDHIQKNFQNRTWHFPTIELF